MNVLYDSDGYKYPMDDYRQIYVQLEAEPTYAGVSEEEKQKETKTEKILCQRGHCWCHCLSSWHKITEKYKNLEASREVPP